MPGPHPISPRNSPSDPSEFLALTFLQPMPNSSAPGFRFNSRATLIPCALSAAANPRWPCCVRLGEGARRNLLCGFCLCEWEFRRIVLPRLRRERTTPNSPSIPLPSSLHPRGMFATPAIPTLSPSTSARTALADPLVDELASVPLDLWAQDRGYAKLHPNLLAM